MDLVKTPLYSGLKGGGGGGRGGIPRSKNKRCDDEIREPATRGARDDAETSGTQREHIWITLKYLV